MNQPSRKRQLNNALILAVYVLLASGAPVLAQELSRVDAGYRLAQEFCAECHAIEPDELDSPNMDAPAFYDVANKTGITVMALSVWFRTPHPTMPNFVIREDETSDLTAYILNLKKLGDRIIPLPEDADACAI